MRTALLLTVSRNIQVEGAWSTGETVMPEGGLSRGGAWGVYQ